MGVSSSSLNPLNMVKEIFHNPIKGIMHTAMLPMRLAEKYVERPLLHMIPAVRQASQGRKAMQAYHQNAENMYNEQRSRMGAEQARIAGEQANQQGRHNRGLARANRARSGSIFGDENDVRLGGR
jgi:hypothetical protein